MTTVSSNQSLAQVAAYDRVLAVSSERVWENVLDWEHLPWLHAQAFQQISLLHEDRDGWTADVVFADETVGKVQVRLERSKWRYTTTTLEGPGEGGAIVTTLEPRGERTTGIRVEFFLPQSSELLALGPEVTAEVGQFYVELYRGLWDQDEEMMLGRQAQLDARKEQVSSAQNQAQASLPIQLGAISEIRGRVPFLTEFAGRRYRIVEVNGRLYAHDVVCPHRLGPLEDVAVVDGCIVCPWHGYRFDVATGSRIGSDGCEVRGGLPAAPAVCVADDGMVTMGPQS